MLPSVFVLAVVSSALWSGASFAASISSGLSLWSTALPLSTASSSTTAAPSSTAAVRTLLAVSSTASTLSSFFFLSSGMDR